MSERGPFCKFLVSDDKPSLKLVFDNLKNYVVVGAGAYVVQKFFDAMSDLTVALPMTIALGLAISVAAVLNLMQTAFVLVMVHRELRAHKSRHRESGDATRLLLVLFEWLYVACAICIAVAFASIGVLSLTRAVLTGH